MRLAQPFIAIACLALLAVPAACGRIPPTPVSGSSPPSALSRGETPARSTAPGRAGDCSYLPSGDPARPVQLPSATGVSTNGVLTFVMSTNAGDVRISMDRSKAPCTVNSFSSLAKQGYFDNTRCHRLADSGLFVLQCGDPTGTGMGGPGYVFADETDGKESYTTGVVAMANAGPDTNGSQFFLVFADSTSLDQRPNYTIFGRMSESSVAVVARIAADGQDGSKPDGTGRPNNPAEIISARQR